MPRKPKSTEELIQRAQQAAQSGITPLLEEQEDVVMNRLLAGFRSGQYTHDFLVAHVAVLAELRMMQARVLRQVLEGVAAGEKLTGENHG